MGKYKKINVFIDCAIRRSVAATTGVALSMSHRCHSHFDMKHIYSYLEKNFSFLCLKMCCNDDGFWWINKYRNVMRMCNILEPSHSDDSIKARASAWIIKRERNFDIQAEIHKNIHTRPVHFQKRVSANFSPFKQQQHFLYFHQQTHFYSFFLPPFRWRKWA